MTTRDGVKEKKPDEKPKQVPAESSIIESDTETLEAPSSHSLPNMTWKEGDKSDGSEDSLYDSYGSDRPRKQSGAAWRYHLKRDF
jgi:hypothetical protein